MLSDNRNSRDSSPANYNLRRDHSKPKRYLEDAGFVTGPPSDRGPSKSPSVTPQKLAKKKDKPSPAKRPSHRSPLPGSSAKQAHVDHPLGPSGGKRGGEGAGKSGKIAKESAGGSESRESPIKRRIKKENVDLGGGRAEIVPPGLSPRKIRPHTDFIARQSPAKTGRSQRIQATSDLSGCLKENLRRLKNVLKLPKARRWFFYSDIDQELFLGDNEFCQCLRESFPNLKCRQLTRMEWAQIRRLIGKPRRCSQAFFDEERSALELKRQKIRDIHNGVLLSLDNDLIDIPQRIPPPLVVGSKVYARVRPPRIGDRPPVNNVYTKDGIFTGRIDAVMHKSYRIIFDKEVVRPAVVMDFEVMRESEEDLNSVSYYLEKNRATAPLNLRAASSATNPPQLFLSPQKVLSADSSPLMHYDPVLSAAVGPKSPKHGGSSSTKGLGGAGGARGDEKVGNFPVRLLVMLVKLGKLIEMKKGLVRQVQDLNGQAERMNLVGEYYPRQYQEKYAQVVVDLEQLNKQIQAYLNGVSDYQNSLLPHLTEVTVTSRPDTLRKLCTTHAQQIVRHCNTGLNVQSKRILDLVTALTALLLQGITLYLCL